MTTATQPSHPHRCSTATTLSLLASSPSSAGVGATIAWLLEWACENRAAVLVDGELWFSPIMVEWVRVFLPPDARILTDVFIQLGAHAGTLILLFCHQDMRDCTDSLIAQPFLRSARGLTLQRMYYQTDLRGRLRPPLEPASALPSTEAQQYRQTSLRAPPHFMEPGAELPIPPRRRAFSESCASFLPAPTAPCDAITASGVPPLHRPSSEDARPEQRPPTGSPPCPLCRALGWSFSSPFVRCASCASSDPLAFPSHVGRFHSAALPSEHRPPGADHAERLRWRQLAPTDDVRGVHGQSATPAPACGHPLITVV